MNVKLFSRHTGAERVDGGLYWSHRDAGIVSIPRDGGALPGQGSDHYTHMPMLAALVVGPILGTAFAFFLPAAGIVGLVQLVIGRGARVPEPARSKVARTVDYTAQRAEFDPQI